MKIQIFCAPITEGNCVHQCAPDYWVSCAPIAAFVHSTCAVHIAFIPYWGRALTGFFRIKCRASAAGIERTGDLGGEIRLLAIGFKCRNFCTAYR